MNNKIGLLVGGLVLLLVSTAGATTTSQVACGSVGSAGNGNVAFTTMSAATVNGSSVVSGGVATITCTGFTVPSGQTLDSLTVEVTDDANQSLGTNSQVSWTWTYSGEPVSPTPNGLNSETGTGTGLSFNSCVGTGTLACNVLETFTTNTTYTGATTGSFSFTVTPSATGMSGAGLGLTGSDSAAVLIQFTYGPTASVPEPASLLLIGSGLIGLGVFARRKRRN